MDSGFGEEVVILKIPGLPGNRLVFASTGPVNRDYDDVRRFSDAAANGIKRSVVGNSFFPRLVRKIPGSPLLVHVSFQGVEGRDAASTAGLPSTQGL